MAKRKRHERIKLPGGCSISQPIIHPKNWKQVTSSCKDDWYIFYRFYDPVRKPKGHPRQVKGMNDYKTAEERRQVTEYLLQDELALLKSGYNPITKSYEAEGSTDTLSRWTPLDQALQLAASKLSVADTTKRDIRGMLHWIPLATRLLNISHMPVGEVRQRHIRMILDQCSGLRSRVDGATGKEIKASWSNHKFNKYRSYLMILFSEIVEVEAIEQNPCREIKVKKKTKRKRKILTDKQRVDVDKRLREVAYEFWRFLHIFFHSGCRITEILALKGKDVTLGSSHFVRLVKKGQQYEELDGIIKDIALPLWKEALEGCGPEDYIFSRGLKPGPKSIRVEQISRRWRRSVKKKLKVEADFYSLKHLNTTETAAIAGDEAAAAHNAHKGTAMVVKIYDVGRQDREHEKLKKINNPFAGS